MLRMGQNQYKRLVDKLTAVLKKENTTFRPAVTVDERLSVTLTYLAYGKLPFLSEYLLSLFMCDFSNIKLISNLFYNLLPNFI